MFLLAISKLAVPEQTSALLVILKFFSISEIFEETIVFIFQ